MLRFWNTARGFVGSGVYCGDLFSAYSVQEFSKDMQLIAEHLSRDIDAVVASLPGR
jgi:hypothetical protein